MNKPSQAENHNANSTPCRQAEDPSGDRSGSVFRPSHGRDGKSAPKEGGMLFDGYEYDVFISYVRGAESINYRRVREAIARSKPPAHYGAGQGGDSGIRETHHD